MSPFGTLRFPAPLLSHLGPPTYTQPVAFSSLLIPEDRIFLFTIPTPVPFYTLTALNSPPPLGKPRNQAEHRVSPAWVEIASLLSLSCVTWCQPSSLFQAQSLHRHYGIVTVISAGQLPSLLTHKPFYPLVSTPRFSFEATTSLSLLVHGAPFTPSGQLALGPATRIGSGKAA